MRKIPVLAATCAFSLALAFGLTACGGSGGSDGSDGSDEGQDEAVEEAAEPEGEMAGEPESVAEPETEAPEAEAGAGELGTMDYENHGEVFFDFPSDTFEVDESAILDTIRAKDGSVKITFNSAYSYEVDGVQAQIDYIDGYADDEEFRAEDLEIAGMAAHRIWHVDSDWGDLYMRTVIDFGDNATERYTGMNIAVTGTDWDRINAADVEAIIESIRFA